jgi:hypothetical protein
MIAGNGSVSICFEMARLRILQKNECLRVETGLVPSPGQQCTAVEHKWEGHDFNSLRKNSNSLVLGKGTSFTRAAKGLKMCPRFSA